MKLENTHYDPAITSMTANNVAHLLIIDSLWSLTTINDYSTDFPSTAE